MMDCIAIRGGNPLQGHIYVSGAKNAALPLMVTSLLTEEPVILSNIPHLVDITTQATLLSELGVEITLDGTGHDGHLGKSLKLHAKTIASTTAPYEIVRKMRASIWVLGPLLARCREAKVSLPGGCAIGTRAVDLHIKGLEAMGAEIKLENGYIHARAPQGLKGCHFHFSPVSVGATENLMMAAALAEGETILENSALEPEVGDLARCLNSMGAKIEGAGTKTLRIQGVKKLYGTSHRVMADRIEAGTYVLAAAITKGDLYIHNIHHSLIEALLTSVKRTGTQIIEEEDYIRVIGPQVLESVDITTEPFPGYPTDLQAQWIALMTVAKGKSHVIETIFDNRFMHVPELCRMGASININGAMATIEGVKKLTGAPVMATDLRASVSLILAGLAAEGETILNRVYHLDRGYERIESKLTACGADIRRFRVED
jgi:UDP-N-acetylglucosamine 1-carboxyvinyltransferase